MMKFDIKKLANDLNPCYVDKNGNLISVIGFTAEDAAKIKGITDNVEDWCVARISKEGDVEVISFFKDADSAENALHVICEKNGWTLRSN